MMISKCFIVALCVVGIVTVFSEAKGSPVSDTQLHPAALYLESTGMKEKTFQWRHPTVQEEVIIVNEEDAAFVNHCDRAGSTYAWDFQQGRQTVIHAVREGNVLRISGTLRGKPIDTAQTIDERPWFQPLSFSLRSFLDSPETKTSFWTIRSDNLEVVTMQAKKGDTEEITVVGRRIQARKVEIRREGFLAAFWQATFWFRKGDRVFVRYQGIHGPPGTRETVVQLSKELYKK